MSRYENPVLSGFPSVRASVRPFRSAQGLAIGADEMKHVLGVVFDADSRRAPGFLIKPHPGVAAVQLLRHQRRLGHILTS